MAQASLLLLPEPFLIPGYFCQQRINASGQDVLCWFRAEVSQSFTCDKRQFHLLLLFHLNCFTIWCCAKNVSLTRPTVAPDPIHQYSALKFPTLGGQARWLQVWSEDHPQERAPAQLQPYSLELGWASTCLSMCSEAHSSLRTIVGLFWPLLLLFDWLLLISSMTTSYSLTEICENVGATRKSDLSVSLCIPDS